MQLVKALRLGAVPRLAFVGAGGKTSAMFHLARELSQAPKDANRSPVILTATTHLSIEQTGWADHHFSVQNKEEIDRAVVGLRYGIILFTGPQVEIERTQGLTGEVLERLWRFCEAEQLPLLVEADGSRSRPLKAPAEHEPVIPSWVDGVVVVAGFSGLGQTLDERWVHRPERFARLAGLQPGDKISADALRRVLVNPEGGLKDIPAAARVIAMLNQVEDLYLRERAENLAEALLEGYNAALLTSFLSEDVPAPVFKAIEPVGGILLAAGGSQRLGQPKQLMPWRGQPLVRHAAQAALDGGLSPVIVVTGAYQADVRSALADLPLVFVHNPDWRSGQSSSLAAGLQAAPPELGALVFLLADQPWLTPQLLRRLVDVHRQTLDAIVAPQVGGRRGNPVLFDRKTFVDLARLEGDVGGRALFPRYPVTMMPWNDKRLLIDIDSPEDYRRLLDGENASEG